MVHGDEVFISAVSRLRYLISTKKNGPTEKRVVKPRQSRGHAVYVQRMGRGVLISQNILSPHADSLVSVHMQEATIHDIFTHT